MSTASPIVYIVDDDEGLRALLQALGKSMGVTARAFPSASKFLEQYNPRQPGCLVLDIFMPGMSGLELQDELNRRGAVIPVIFITGHADVASAVAAVRHGAFNYLQKPFSNAELVANVRQALEVDRRNRELLAQQEVIRERIALLTPREREVLELIVRGLASKVMAEEMGLSQRTVELHRSRVMGKMGASSIAQLVRMFMDSQRGGGHPAT
ncbi:MAG TPA: response regulator [Steroidobacteraceae bacterium]|jgi:two-component system response regulator FixJ|nr:response regulator [Steroidobacteraceae bacterium]